MTFHPAAATRRNLAIAIAITLATREDSEAISRIEKLIGHRIPRSSESVADEPVAAEKRAKARPAKVQTPAVQADKRPQEQPDRPVTKPKKPSERTPVLEDISSDWNGPMPSFLSRSAG